MTASSTARAGLLRHRRWLRPPRPPSATPASGTFTSARPATTATSAESIVAEDGSRRTAFPAAARRGNPSERAPPAREALHDLALGLVVEQAAVTAQIGGDLAFRAPLLGGDQGVEDAPPERLARRRRDGVGRLGVRADGGIVGVGDCAHDGLSSLCGFVFASLETVSRMPDRFSCASPGR